MTIATWKKEFYATGASTVARDKTKTDVDLIDHCIVKWQGLLPRNVAKHEVDHMVGFGMNHIQPINIDTFNYPTFAFDASSCALCQRHNPPSRDSSCHKCPLAKSRGGAECYHTKYGEDVSPYNNSDPTAMIKALKKARKWVLKQNPA